MNINELDMKVDQIRELKRMIEEAEAEITSIEDSIKATMTEQDTDELRGTKCKVTWKQTSSTRIDSKSLKKELPDIAAKYSRTHYHHLSPVSHCVRKGRIPDGLDS